MLCRAMWGRKRHLTARGFVRARVRDSGGGKQNRVDRRIIAAIVVFLLCDCVDQVVPDYQVNDWHR